jgi:hypothetical protein
MKPASCALRSSRSCCSPSSRAKLADLPAHTHGAEGAEADRKRAVIEAALARARARRQQATS